MKILEALEELLSKWSKSELIIVEYSVIENTTEAVRKLLTCKDAMRVLNGDVAREDSRGDEPEKKMCFAPAKTKKPMRLWTQKQSWKEREMQLKKAALLDDTDDDGEEEEEEEETTVGRSAPAAPLALTASAAPLAPCAVSRPLDNDASRFGPVADASLEALFSLPSLDPAVLAPCGQLVDRAEISAPHLAATMTREQLATGFKTFYDLSCFLIQKMASQREERKELRGEIDKMKTAALVAKRAHLAEISEWNKQQLLLIASYEAYVIRMRDDVTALEKKVNAIELRRLQDITRQLVWATTLQANALSAACACAKP